MEVADKEHADDLKKELESYKAKKPVRELLSEDNSAGVKQQEEKRAAAQPEK